MAVVGDAGSAGATEVEERVVVPDKVAVLDKAVVLDEAVPDEVAVLDELAVLDEMAVLGGVACGKPGLTGVPVATFLTFLFTILRSQTLSRAKTKLILFQKCKRRCDSRFYICSEKIEIVQNYTYLGTCI